ncbi:MAG: DMT family transporter [Xanthomonadales bacterium]|nr:DMT family transporter [Xanthomonadales bacterium]
MLFSGKAILAKFQYRYGVDSLDVMALRMVYSLPLFVSLAVIETRRAWRRSDSLSWRELTIVVILGLVGYYLSSLLDFWGLEYVPVSLERLLLFLNPTFVLLIGLLFFGRTVSGRQWLAMLISYLGVALVMIESLRVEGEHIALGSLLVLGAATSYAVYMSVSGELIARVGARRLVAYAMCVSTLATLTHFALRKDPGSLLELPAAVHGLAAANAVFCTFMPVSLTMAAVARVGSATTAQLSVVGPVSLVFLGYWLLGERISWVQIVGTAVVLCGVMVLTRRSANHVPVGLGQGGGKR